MTQLKMSFNQSSNYGLKIKDMEETKVVGKILETMKIIEIFQRKIKISILHAASARGLIMPRKTVGIVESHNVDTARDLGTLKRTVSAKISIKQILFKSMIVSRISLIASNIFSMLPKIPTMNCVETGTWIAVVAITWLKMGASSRILMTPSR